MSLWQVRWNRVLLLHQLHAGAASISTNPSDAPPAARRQILADYSYTLKWYPLMNFWAGAVGNLSLSTGSTPAHRQRMPLMQGNGRRHEHAAKLGRGHSFNRANADMEAEFFTIMPAATGWQLYHGNVGCGWYSRLGPGRFGC